MHVGSFAPREGGRGCGAGAPCRSGAVRRVPARAPARAQAGRLGALSRSGGCCMMKGGAIVPLLRLRACAVLVRRGRAGAAAGG